MSARKDDSGLVYSTEMGRMCPGCGKPAATCACAKGAPPKSDGVVRIMRQTKGRKGKGVCLITGLPPDGLEKLAKELKQRCGTGGTVKEGVIEIQGDHRETLLAELARRGFKARLAGG